MTGQGKTITLGNYWDIITAHQGEIFYTKSGLSFAYQVVGNEMFTDRRERSINRKTFERAILKMQERPDEIRGPKALKLYGAPYIWAILTQLGGVCSVSDGNGDGMAVR